MILRRSNGLTKPTPCGLNSPKGVQEEPAKQEDERKTCSISSPHPVLSRRERENWLHRSYVLSIPSDTLSSTASISAIVVSRPRLNRIAPMPTSGAMPIASRTGDSSTSPS